MLQLIKKICTKISHVGPQRAAKVGLFRFKNRIQSYDLQATQWHEIASLSMPKKIKWITQYTLPKNAAEHNGPFNWHEGYEAAQHTYYKGIVIKIHEGCDLGPDIKTPWDYSRFLWAVNLGRQFEQTGKSQYIDQYQHIMLDWLVHNRYLHGINWLCPMEVAIRAINWIISFTILQDTLSADVRTKMRCSLYDHMRYLEQNWELSDGRTSNHYLSDLVGYLYLVWFFNDAKKQHWVIAEIEREMAWQIFDEGTSYEGSTAYHRLVTELFVHADLMARECGLTFSQSFYAKLKKMQEFISWCNGIKIGDDDSGRIMHFDVLRPTRAQGLKAYAQFGLSIIKTKSWHISMRHAAYQRRQPTGHFHDDAGSITISYKGVPILIDPGSYVYTPSRTWREYFRSAHVHNTLYANSAIKSDMFDIRLPEIKCVAQGEQDGDLYAVNCVYYIDHVSMRKAHKKVECDTLRNSIAIVDRIENVCDAHANLTFAPGIDLHEHNGSWLIMHKGTPIVRLQSDFEYKKYTAWMAPCYGKKIQTVGLRATVKKKKSETKIVAF